jgi:hypothetical protein
MLFKSFKDFKEYTTLLRGKKNYCDRPYSVEEYLYYEFYHEKCNCI